MEGRNKRISGVAVFGIGVGILFVLLFLGGFLRYAMSLVAVYTINVILIVGENSEVKVKKRSVALGGLSVVVGLLIMAISRGHLSKLGLIVGFGGLFLVNLMR